MTLLKSAILSVETARLYKLKILPITMARRTQLTFKTYHIYGKIQEEEGERDGGNREILKFWTRLTLSKICRKEKDHADPGSLY